MKKSSKIIIAVAVVALALLAVVGCIIYYKIGDFVKKVETDKYAAAPEINKVLSGLTGDDGSDFIWPVGGDYYYFGGSGIYYKIDKDLNNYSVPEFANGKDSINVIDIIDDKLYYTANNQAAYSSAPDGSDPLKLNVDPDVIYINDFDNTLYYSVWEPGGGSKDGFYILDPDEKKGSKINDDIPMGFYKDGEKVAYYSSFSYEDAMLKSYDTKSGKVSDILSWDNIVKYFPGHVIDGYIYFADEMDGNLYKIKPDGTGKQLVYDFNIDTDDENAAYPRFVFDKQYAYFKGDEIGKIDLKSGEKTTLYDKFEDCNGINLIGETIYFSIYDDGDYEKVCRIDNNGNNFKSLELK